MERIIVFSKLSKLNSVDPEFRNRKDVKLLGTHCILIYDTSTNQFKDISDFSQQGLYFVQDSIKKEVFDDKIAELDKTQIAILKHTQPEFEFVGFRTVRKGIHESRGPYYHKLVEVLIDAKGEIFNRIIEEVVRYDHELEEKIKLKNALLSKKTYSLKGDLGEKYNSSVDVFTEAIIGKDIYSSTFQAAFKQLLQDLEIES